MQVSEEVVNYPFKKCNDEKKVHCKVVHWERNVREDDTEKRRT